MIPVMFMRINYIVNRGITTLKRLKKRREKAPPFSVVYIDEVIRRRCFEVGFQARYPNRLCGIGRLSPI